MSHDGKHPASEDARKIFGAHLFDAGAQPLPGAFAPMVSAIIDDLIAFAVAHAAGKRSARGSLDAARMRLDELHGTVNAKRALLSGQREVK